MAETSKIESELILFETFDDKIIITLKSKKHKPFVTQVKDFNYKEEDPRVIFKRCEETIFPADTEAEKEKEYITYIKNIKSVNIYKMPNQKIIEN